MLDDYQQSRVWYTEDAFKRVTDTRDRLLSDSGLLQPVGDRGASFFHFSFQEFLSAERLADLDKERIVDIFREHGGTPEWRNTLSFLFGAQLSNNVGPQRAVEVLLGVLDQVVETMSPVRALLAADCIEVLRGRQVSLEEEPLRRMREACLHGMRGERPAAERCQLGDALGRIGDHRFRHNVFWLPNDDLLGFVEVDGSIPCYIGRFPVTVAQFRVFVDDRGSNGGFMLEIRLRCVASRIIRSSESLLMKEKHIVDGLRLNCDLIHTCAADWRCLIRGRRDCQPKANGGLLRPLIRAAFRGVGDWVRIDSTATELGLAVSRLLVVFLVEGPRSGSRS